MDVHNASLAAVCVEPKQYPEKILPEFAFVGRSNVGKSSLINTMINRKSLARTSQSPGKTRTINFYNIEDILYFVDLPGYGYAKASKSETQKWGKMIERYLLNREQLLSIIFLLDIRHSPSAQDLQMLEWLRYYKKDMVIALTKADKLKRSQLPRHIKIIRQAVGQELLIPFSKETKIGKEEIWEIIENQRRVHQNAI
ncbi:MAG: ribosome biogenesis GTP-binding protein YihA/YsxC [Defluviitaleaceae bacterium]|nr:ribosome biogenesis GTP-binding protein YihA/YsxC [Defluviitaleaceae bacterium]